MKAVLISIQPKWCELIASGKKTVEVRKTKPKLETPFKVYIYCTKGSQFLQSRNNAIFYLEDRDFIGGHGAGLYVRLNGTVIGEFVCDRIEEIGFSPEMHGQYICKDQSFVEQSCVPFEEMFDYLDEEYGYGWHISDLVIYDKPKELSEFYIEGDCDCMNCKSCAWFDRGNGHNVEDDCNLAYKGVSEHKSFKPIIRPPQSWCYVEGVTNERPDKN